MNIAIRTLRHLAVVIPILTATVEAAPQVRIVTSFYPMYIATLNIVQGAPGVELTNMTKPFTGCLHDYQMTPSDLVVLSRADIFVVNGAGMEAFLDKAVGQVPRLKIVNASAGIPLLTGADGTNAHVWLSLELAMRQVDNIARGLAADDPDRAEIYRRNAASYNAKLAALRQRMRAALEHLRRRDIITFHEAFPYFARDLNLNVVAVIEREPGSEPSARELADIVRKVREKGVPPLFVEPQYPAKSAEIIARETGASIYTLDPIVTGPLTADAYLATMEKNLQVLREALK